MTNLKMASRVSCTVVVLGDSKTGKSALIQKFVTGQFREHYAPTSFDKSFASQEVEKHDVEFCCWDTSGSPAYDSVRSLAYLDADVFLLCYKISDPISLYNVKNKWIRELRKHRPDTPVVLCGCQADLRQDPSTVSLLSKTGRAPVTREQALAICCEVGAIHYAETSAKTERGDTVEAFELCALAAIKHRRSNNSNNNNNNNTFKRSPSINSTLSLFDSDGSFHKHQQQQQQQQQPFRRSPSTHSSLSLASNFKMPSLALKRTSTASVTSLRSPDGEMRLLRTFSPEPISAASACRIPPVISEHEAYHSPSPSSMQTFSPQSRKGFNSGSRPSSLCEPLSENELHLSQGTQSRLQRPTSLFRGELLQPHPLRGSFYSPTTATAEPTTTVFTELQRRFDSLSELSSVSSGSFIKSPQVDVVWPNNAQLRPNGLSRRTSYRTHPKMAIPVATPMSPMSPVGDMLGFDMVKSPQLSTSSSFLQQQNSSVQELSSIAEQDSSESSSIFDLKPPKIYESLKSTCSSSNSSDGGSSSKLPSDFSDASSISYKSGSRRCHQQQQQQQGNNVQEQEIIASHLNFVCPKAGVYRPSSSRKAKPNCSVM